MKHLRIYLAIVMLGIAVGASALDDGIYIICSAINRGYVIDNDHSGTADGNNIHLWQMNKSGAQRWLLTNYSNGTVSLANQSVKPNIMDTRTWHMLDVNNSDMRRGNNIHLWTWNETQAQRWILTRNSDGSYTIHSAINRNYVVDLDNSRVANGTNIQLWESNGTAAQHWFFVRVSGH